MPYKGIRYPKDSPIAAVFYSFYEEAGKRRVGCGIEDVEAGDLKPIGKRLRKPI
ncbi:hypothetical protein [Paenibacillus humicus]|uniref:hypothetical protein n=1 Tax=Paenibacillus humicus TaxID=412861 RepID=UPI0013E3C4C2|nr:hypothetical protein [Paenibacillus humicus]